jgi:hypothetical protein
VADRAFVLSLIVGGIALAIGYAMEVRRMRRPSDEWLEDWEIAADRKSAVADAEEIIDEDPLAGGVGVAASSGGGGGGTGTGRVTTPVGPGGGSPVATEERQLVTTHGGLLPPDEEVERAEHIVGHGPALRGTPAGQSVATEEHTIAVANKPAASKFFAVFVPLAYLALIVYLIVASVSDSVPDLQGGDAAALVGGIALITMFGASFARNRNTFLETSAEHIVDGLVFAFKAMGVVLPIAGFFFLGNGDFSGQIMSLGEGVKGPAFLYDLVVAGQDQLPTNGLITAFGILIVGMIAGLEGSGFSGLPLTGSLAGSLSHGAGVSSPTLAAIGQMGNIWSGGGTLVAWSSLLAVAGFVRVPAVELARKCFLPVVAGLVVCTIFAVLVFG